MRVSVKFFSFFRQIAGIDQLSLDLQEGADLAELLNVLSKKFDSPSFKDEQVTMMVNHKNAFPGTILRDGDNVLLLPLLGGG
jgi:molybdopterin converting factor small subunit